MITMNRVLAVVSLISFVAISQGHTEDFQRKDMTGTNDTNSFQGCFDVSSSKRTCVDDALGTMTVTVQGGLTQYSLASPSSEALIELAVFERSVQRQRLGYEF